MIDQYDVIFIDDETTMTTIFNQVVNLKHQHWRACSFNDSLALYELIEAKRISASIWIIDLMMPGKNGIEIAQAIRGSGDFTSVLIGYTALDPQSLSRNPDYRNALDVFSRIIGKQEGFIKLLAGLDMSILRRVKPQSNH